MRSRRCRWHARCSPPRTMRWTPMLTAVVAACSGAPDPSSCAFVRDGGPAPDEALLESGSDATVDLFTPFDCGNSTVVARVSVLDDDSVPVSFTGSGEALATHRTARGTEVSVKFRPS